MRLLSIRRRRRERGNVFIEFGLISLIMVPLFFGVIDYSRVFYYASIAQGAARAGTQYAVFQAPNEANTSAITSAATADAGNVPTAQNLTVTPTYWCICSDASSSSSTVSCTGTCDTGATMYTYSQVNTQLTFTTYFQYPLLPTSITVKGQSIMRVR
ncbi:MAG TPA: TadE family protein [Bryobacteraceae bacterium]|jgi:Flp pilus assembly protein TadG